MLIKSAKQKGNSFEYDCEYSLKAKYPDIRALEKRGGPLGLDLISDLSEVVVECKRWRTISWNELEGIYRQLMDNSPTAKERYAIYKTNFQPVLVFYFDDDKGYIIRPFEKVFGVPFLTRPKKNKEGNK
jgi:hypothetical protein